MKKTPDVDLIALARLLHQEGWDQPLAEVHMVHLKPWQQAVFWGLRAYIVVMLLIVIWAFGRGTFH